MHVRMCVCVCVRARTRARSINIRVWVSIIFFLLCLLLHSKIRKTLSGLGFSRPLLPFPHVAEGELMGLHTQRLTQP